MSEHTRLKMALQGRCKYMALLFQMKPTPKDSPILNLFHLIPGLNENPTDLLKQIKFGLSSASFINF